MKKRALMFLLLVLLTSAFSNKNESFELPFELKTQREIVAHLARAKALKDGTLITNRSSTENKVIARKYLQSLIEDIGIEAETQNYSFPNVNPIVDILFNPFYGANVFATLPSTTGGEEYVIIGAHYDSDYRCPGAIDNATGVALIYQVFYKLSQQTERSKNLIVVFFDQEEEDLIGSQAFVKYIQSNNLTIHSVHTFDTIGWDQDGDQAVEIELPTDVLEEVYKKHAKELNIPIYISPCNSTDHHSFRVAGYDAVGLTDEYYNGDYPPHKDTPDDKYETVNFDYLTSSTNLVEHVISDIIR